MIVRRAIVAALGVGLVALVFLLWPRPTVVRLTVATLPRALPPPPPPKPVHVRRQGVELMIGPDWLMRETEPMLVPDTEPRPVTVLFHAICADPQWHCEWFQYFKLEPQWQICPRAPGRCSGGGYQWSASVKDTRRLVETAIATTKERHPGRVRDDGVVLVGFSNGAYAVSRIVHDVAAEASPPLKIRGIVLHGADAHFDAKDLRKLGARVALAAGDLDGSARAMKVEAERLAREGIEARYVSLGPYGHFIPVDSGKQMAELIDWSRGAH